MNTPDDILFSILIACAALCTGCVALYVIFTPKKPAANDSSSRGSDESSNDKVDNGDETIECQDTAQPHNDRWGGPRA